MPYPNEHSCRLINPKEFTKFRRVNKAEKEDGKPIDVIYGVKNKKTKIQALRFKTKDWKEKDARLVCELREGEFHPAKK